MVAEKLIWDKQVRVRAREARHSRTAWSESASCLVAKIPMARFITTTGLIARTRIADPSMVAF